MRADISLPTLFARTDYWTQLNAEEQSLHMIRALATLYHSGRLRVSVPHAYMAISMHTPCMMAQYILLAIVVLPAGITRN